MNNKPRQKPTMKDVKYVEFLVNEAKRIYMDSTDQEEMTPKEWRALFWENFNKVLADRPGVDFENPGAKFAQRLLEAAFEKMLQNHENGKRGQEAKNAKNNNPNATEA